MLCSYQNQKIEALEGTIININLAASWNTQTTEGGRVLVRARSNPHGHLQQTCQE